MVYVHLSIKDIPASADEVWDLIGVNFVDIIEWSTQHSKCRTAHASEIPLKWSKDKFKSKLHMPIPCLGRVVQYPASSRGEQKGELVQTLIEYNAKQKQLAYACSFPLPIVDAYFCTIYVVQRKDIKTQTLMTTSEVHMEIELYVLPGFCWLGELINLRGKLKSDKRGPCGELKDIKQYFINKNAAAASKDTTTTTKEEKETSKTTTTTAAAAANEKETTASAAAPTTITTNEDNVVKKNENNNNDNNDNTDGDVHDDEVTVEISQGHTPSNPTVLHKHVNDRFF